jgi:hypothetical protein
LVDARDLKSLGGPPPCRFKSGPRHQKHKGVIPILDNPFYAGCHFRGIGGAGISNKVFADSNRPVSSIKKLALYTSDLYNQKRKQK